MAAEQDAIRRRRGKWGEAGVPHKGWSCIGDYDTFEELGEDEFVTCGMCESAQVRFVHIMRNERYPDDLLCGCICAGHMAEDLATAEMRDKAMRSVAGRRDHFPERKGWKVSLNGTPHITVLGYHLLVVHKRDGRFAVGATPPGSTERVWGIRRYQTIEHAQKGCFDAMRFLQEQAATA